MSKFLERITATGLDHYEALKHLKKQVPKDHVLVIEYSMSGKDYRTIKEKGKSEDLAFQLAESKLPKNARDIVKTVIQKGNQRSIEIRTWLPVNDVLKGVLEIHPNEFIKDGKLLEAPKSGLFGVGAKKGLVQVNIASYVQVSISYSAPMELVGYYGKASANQLIKSMMGWYRREAALKGYMLRTDLICDDCNRPIRQNFYLRPGRISCENCTLSSLSRADWESALKNMNFYFGPGVPPDILEQARQIEL
ncbi:MAG: hypothetical protein FD133_749 [Erysipelotrichaceae bacterium]|nr:MAG: hypothetical protein FD179_1191 [Erysipelotrichaceae bacterium]TXT18590.1 MAG: hypothetical protein FD133_749 [Erysipelotrichaceae bacterium]